MSLRYPPCRGQHQRPGRAGSAVFLAETSLGVRICCDSRGAGAVCHGSSEGHPALHAARHAATACFALFLGYYVAYVTYLILAVQKHAALPFFSSAMLSFVLPLTVVTLVVLMLRPARH